MKYLKDRKEISIALNSNKYPILILDTENNKGFTDTPFCEGQKVRVLVERDSKMPVITKGNIIMDDDGDIAITNNSTCLKADFGYDDIMEASIWANAPIIKKEQEVIVIMQHKSTRDVEVRMMKVSNKLDPYCVIVAKLEDIE